MLRFIFSGADRTSPVLKKPSHKSWKITVTPTELLAATLRLELVVNMLRLPRSSVRHLHATATQCNRRLKKSIPELLPAEKLDSLASSLEQNALSKASEQDTLFEMLEQDRPKSINLRKKAYEKLITKLDTSYTVDQLQAYLRSRSIPSPKHKSALVDRIVRRAWGIQSPEERDAARKLVSEVLPSSKRELVLLISDQGQFLTQIERETKVSITIQSQDQSLLLQGRKSDIKEAKEMLSQLPEPLESVRRQASLPHRWQELERIIPEISKMSHAFISAEKDGLIRISAKTQDAVDSAERLLDVVTGKLKLAKSTRSPDEADHTFLRKVSSSDEKNLAFLPFYDPIAMPLTAQGSGWSRLQATSADSNEATTNLRSSQKSIRDEEIVSAEHSNGQSTSLARMSDIFRREFDDYKSSNIDIHARFGDLIFQNPLHPQNEPNYMLSPINGSFSINDLQKQYNWKQERQHFFPSQPPARLTSTFTPLSLQPKRTVSLEFIDSDFWKSTRAKGYERLLLEFDIGNNQQLICQTAELEKQRSVVDYVGFNLPDLRICGRVYHPIISNTQSVEVETGYQDVVETIRDQCQLIEHDRLRCPSYAAVLKTPMTLLSVVFQTKREYLVNGENMLVVSDTSDQDGNIRARQVTLLPIDQTTQRRPENALAHWSSFVDGITHLMTRWH